MAASSFIASDAPCGVIASAGRAIIVSLRLGATSLFTRPDIEPDIGDQLPDLIARYFAAKGRHPVRTALDNRGEDIGWDRSRRSTCHPSGPAPCRHPQEMAPLAVVRRKQLLSFIQRVRIFGIWRLRAILTGVSGPAVAASVRMESTGADAAAGSSKRRCSRSHATVRNDGDQ